MSTNTETESAREIAKRLKATGLECNCDFDSWQPEVSTGHSWVCRIHKAVMAKLSGPTMSTKEPS